MAKITVDQDTCIGCGACTAVAPDLFEMDDNGKSKAKKGETSSEKELKAAQEAEETCPVQAIKVE
ncbi:MAG: ferredoxin [Candidatus Woesearchaeota archaeon]